LKCEPPDRSRAGGELADIETKMYLEQDADTQPVRGTYQRGALVIECRVEDSPLCFLRLSDRNTDSAGGMTLHVELYDSVTGDLIAESMDRKADRSNEGIFTSSNQAANQAAAKVQSTTN
jgi:hypothetical protein